MCEKCWTDAGGDAMAYAVLVRERTESGESCTPREQCGERHTKGGDDLCACRRAKQNAERAVIAAAKAWAALETEYEAMESGAIVVTQAERDARFKADIALNALRHASRTLRAQEGES